MNRDMSTQEIMSTTTLHGTSLHYDHIRVIAHIQRIPQIAVTTSVAHLMLTCIVDKKN